MNDGRGNVPDPVTSPAAPAPRREVDEVAERSSSASAERDRSLREPPTIPVSDTREEIENLHRKLRDKDIQLKKVKEAYHSIRKESDRSRQRIEQNLRRTFEKSKNEFIGQFVEVLDNIDRAIEAVENNFDSDSVLQGIILLRSRLVQVLRGEGLEKICVDGQPFDPTHSEAAAVEPVESESADNVVIRELQRGYMLKGALLRPARVVVGRLAGPRTANGEPPLSEPEGDDG